MIFSRITGFIIAFFFFVNASFGQPAVTDMSYQVTVQEPANHIYHVVLKYNHCPQPFTELNMCAWTPGYYEILDYAKALQNFKVTGAKGKEISWSKPSDNVWKINTGKETSITVSYDINAVVSFVGNVYLDENRGYITPGGLFLYASNQLRKPVTVQMIPYKSWKNIVATGLDSLPGKNHTFYAANFDVLYDSPFLMGNLDEFPSFTIKGIPHYFIGYGIGKTDGARFMSELKKVIESGTNIIGDIPYTHYTFLAIGEGGGGIEHLNSTSISYRNGDFLTDTSYSKQFFSFLAHEYFHHYNVKRIRPVELGPFDYSKENITSLLWVSEGFTNYYEYLMVKKAGVMSEGDMLKAFQNHIRAYENKPGHLLQSAAAASRETWSEPPFGKGEEMDAKTISYYDKGCIIGLMMDLKIRNQTNNQKSLDDVMRTLYKEYYQKKKRGFTELEFRQVCENIADTSLQEIFDYANTVQSPDYPKYFAYAGLIIDTTMKEIPKAYTGLYASGKGNAVTVSKVDWNSPAWTAGIRAKDTILAINGSKATTDLVSKTSSKENKGKLLVFSVLHNGTEKSISIIPGSKYEKSFLIERMQNPTALQAAIYNSWMRN